MRWIPDYTRKLLPSQPSVTNQNPGAVCTNILYLLILCKSEAFICCSSAVTVLLSYRPHKIKPIHIAYTYHHKNVVRVHSRPLFYHFATVYKWELHTCFHKVYTNIHTNLMFITHTITWSSISSTEITHVITKHAVWVHIHKLLYHFVTVYKCESSTSSTLILSLS